MAHLPYGGFISDAVHPEDEPWRSLAIIQDALYRGDPVPPPYAAWLGEAIIKSQNDLPHFLLLLGLKSPKGKPSQFHKDAWLVVGRRIDELEGDGLTSEQAINAVLDEAAVHPEWIGGIPDRRTVQRWRDDYRKACFESWHECQIEDRPLTT